MNTTSLHCSGYTTHKKSAVPREFTRDDSENMTIKAAYSFPGKNSSSNARRDRQASSGSNDPFHYDTLISTSTTANTGDRNKELPLQPLHISSRNTSDALLLDTSSTLFEYVQALHDYSAVASGSNVCLSFHAGQIIKVLSRDTSGWWDGELEDRRGWFPSNYVVRPLYLHSCRIAKTRELKLGGFLVYRL